MDHLNDLERTYSTDTSSESMYTVEVNMDMEGRKSMHGSAGETMSPVWNSESTSAPVCVPSFNTEAATTFGTQFQDLVIRALFQSTAALIGPPLGVMSIPQDMSSASPALSKEGLITGNTWNEGTYNIAQARRKRKRQVTRTSAGEESDSQEDYPIPENESPHDRSVRTRKLNRYRARRAADLTCNRKALKKLPYVIYVDGMAKARGIHKHLWRAALRGQCGRLDPTMDNINHHPRNVVDSIWHALEKEWEFQGFAHRAREMFERSATKFMRNRKMQLKYKCQKSIGGSKPNDVNEAHWLKIVDLTKKSPKLSASTTSQRNTSEGKNQIRAGDKENDNPAFLQLGTGQDSESGSPDSRLMISDSFMLPDDDVDARIKSLQMELLRLQKSRESHFAEDNGAGVSELQNVVEDDLVCGMEKGNFRRGSEQILRLGIAPLQVVDDANENVMPSCTSRDHLRRPPSKSTIAGRNEKMQGKLLHIAEEKKSSLPVPGHRQVQEWDSGLDVNETKIDCGNVIRLFAFTGGRKEEIGKAIVMGLAGSKYAKRVISKGWRSIKVTSCTSFGASLTCPFPARWTEQLKKLTV